MCYKQVDEQALYLVQVKAHDIRAFVAPIALYYPPRDIFVLNTEKYRPGCIFFVYSGASVPWIISVNNFRFFTNISETILPTNIYYISLERSFSSASAHVHCIRIPCRNKVAIAS